MVVRVIECDIPHPILPHSREIEFVVQRAIGQAKRHVPPESIGRHPMLLNPEITGITAVVFPIIVHIVVALEPKKPIANRLRMIHEHRIS